MSDAVRIIRTTPDIVITGPRLSRAQLRTIGGSSIDILTKRVTEQHLGSDGSPFPPYSGRGPIYIPVVGIGKVNRRRFDETFGWFTTQTLRRTKSNLSGQEVLTAKDIRRMRESGRVAIIDSRKGARKVDSPRGIGVIHVGRSAKCIKFANWADYKRALGKSGLRDLQLSNRMQGAITVVEIGPNSVTIGFTRDLEEKKAEGNEDRTPWFGLSDNDEWKLQPTIEELIFGIAQR